MSRVQAVIHDDNDEGGRRHDDPRPQPRHRTDLNASNSTLWKGLGWVLLVLALVFPYPWWW